MRTVEHYSTLQRKEILTRAHITKWMNLNDIMLSKTSQSQKDKYYVIPFIWDP